MDWSELGDPELADAHEVLQAFEEQALAPVNSFTDLSELPPPSDRHHHGRFLPDSHDGPVDPTGGKHGSGEPMLAVVQPALKSQPILRPPSPANPSLDVGVVSFKRSRDIKSDLLILRVAASVPLTSRLNIDWRTVREKLQGSALSEWSSDRVARAFHSLIRRVDSGQPPWTVDTSPSEVEEGLQLITKLKCTANVGLPSEKVPLLRLPLQRYNLQHKVRRPPRKMSYLPTETAPRHGRTLKINSLQVPSA